ncbi:UxaA family hydrolase [Bradyrhizobium manausense]|uniref:UxaA family hydrolase n=1 Tax=Bradyrhizobium manausense TaxID=989370 RepID=UPI003D9B0BAC
MFHAYRSITLSSLQTKIGWDAVQIAPDDDVAVALRDLSGIVRVRCSDRIEKIALLELIPFGHKFAFSDLAAGQEVRKYGAPIGRLTRSVLAGQHVHVHNLKSQRAKIRGG